MNIHYSYKEGEVIDGMVYVSEIDQWVEESEYREFINEY